MRSRHWWPLSVMMGLIYGVMGAWWPLLALHLDDLGLSGRSRGWIFATLSLGAVLAPLGVGRLADRKVPIERLLTGISMAGAVLLAAIAGTGIRDAGLLFVLFLVYWLLVAPSLGLSTTMSLRNLERPGEEFGGVRAMGTVGWMVAGWMSAGLMLWTGTSRTGQGAEEGFWLAVGLSITLALVAALWLPHTPPLHRPERPSRKADLAEAIQVLKRPSLALYLLTAFGVTLTTPYMYQVIPKTLEEWGLARAWVAPAMSLGQIPEIAGLFALPKLLNRLGFTWTMGLGIAAWVIRYGSLALGESLWVGVAGIPLHGIGVACFIIAGQMYLDKQAPSNRRAETQGLNMVVTTGAATLIGSLYAGEMAAQAGARAGALFWPPFWVNLACLVLWVGVASRFTERGEEVSEVVPDAAGI